MRRRGQPVFYAFDCPGVLYAQHFKGGQGTDLFRLVREQDLEGVVAKRKNAV